MKSSGVFTVNSLVMFIACLRMKRAELPTPHMAAYFTRVLMVAGPGTPTCTGNSIPPARSNVAHSATGPASNRNCVAMKPSMPCCLR